MKKSILFVLLALVSMAGFSQITWNAKVGMNISNYTGDDVDMSAKVGVKLGFGMDYAFNKTWSLQPSLFFSQKGAKTSVTILNNSVEQTVNAMYLELPVMAAARFNVANNTNIVVSAGPYFACGVAGKARTEMVMEGLKTDVKESTFGEDSFDRFDAGLGVGVAAEFGRIIVGLDGQYGLVKVYDADDSPKNMNFTISVGYKF